MINLDLDYTGFEKNIVKKWSDDVRNHDGFISRGMHYVFKFKNDFGASVVKIYSSYGYDLWELAVIRFNHGDTNDWDLDYNTPITNDVIGYLTDDKVRETLAKIKNL